jgi:chitin synthase
MEDDTSVCMGFRYMYLMYYVMIGLMILLTLVASWYIRLVRVGNPYYSLRPIVKMRRSHVLIFIPVYSESKSELENTLDSVVLNDYPIKYKTMFIVVDGKKCGRGNDDMTSNYAKELLMVETDISSDLNYELYVGSYKYIKYVLLIKGENSGKKDSFLYVIRTLMAFNKNRGIDVSKVLKSKKVVDMDEKYTMISKSIIECGLNLNKVDYVLMLDTDTRIDACGLRYLVDYLDSNPFTSAVCGETTLTNSNANMLVMAQYYEYYITHYTLKAFEMLYGDVLVLSGCFALYRRNVLSNRYLLEEYERYYTNNLYRANISQLGEDRLLTNLILRYYPDFNTKYIECAKCYTNVPLSYNTLLSQRRRWTNSLIFCNIMLLMNLPGYKIWKKICFFLVLLFELWIVLLMPLLLTIGYYYSLRVMYDWVVGRGDMVGLVETVLFLCIPIIMCILLGKWRMMGYAVIFIITLPIFSIIIPLYSIYYSDDVSWGNTRKVKDEMDMIRMESVDINGEGVVSSV